MLWILPMRYLQAAVGEFPCVLLEINGHTDSKFLIVVLLLFLGLAV